MTKRGMLYGKKVSANGETHNLERLKKRGKKEEKWQKSKRGLDFYVCV